MHAMNGILRFHPHKPPLRTPVGAEKKIRVSKHPKSYGGEMTALKMKDSRGFVWLYCLLEGELDTLWNLRSTFVLARNPWRVE